MLEEFWTFAKELVPEGRRAFCLNLAVQTSHDHSTAEQILEAAKLWEGWLQEAECKEAPKKIKLQAVKE